MNRELQQKIFFVLRNRYFRKVMSFIRTSIYKFQGMKVGRDVILNKTYITWPHKIAIGNGVRIEHGVYFKHDGIWSSNTSINIGNSVFIGEGCEFNIRKGIVIGDSSLIGSGSRFIDHDHGIALGQLIGVQLGPEAAIQIGSDVWLGCNVVVLKGVEIGIGAVVAAGSIVNKNIPPYEIWAGVPAKKIGERKII